MMFQLAVTPPKAAASSKLRFHPKSLLMSVLGQQTCTVR
jgi:hypothetical protein